MSHTFTLLDVPPTAYAAIRALLQAADYHHAIFDEGDGEVIDMHGIALRSKGGTPTSDVVIGTLLSGTTTRGAVELSINGEVLQMDLGKAREIVGMLQEAIEAAVSDELIFRFLTERVGLDQERAARGLLDFRELRQGARQAVRPM